MDVLPYLWPARLSRGGVAMPRLSCPYLAPGSSRAEELFFDARRRRRGRGAWALLFLASRLLWFAPTVSVGHPRLRLLGNLVEQYKCVATRCRLTFDGRRRAKVAAAETMAVRAPRAQRTSGLIRGPEPAACRRQSSFKATNAFEALMLTACWFGKIGRAGEFSAHHQPGIEQSKVIGPLHNQSYKIKDEV